MKKQEVVILNIKTNVVKKPFRLLVRRHGHDQTETITVQAESLAAAKQQLPDEFEFIALVKVGAEHEQ